ncbi:MAG: phosphomannomutase, partial [Candidatus Doudnabacteria bacterium]|nr:phosphomannomutase [Candidatus Doudnabacteria bacterium]
KLKPDLGVAWDGDGDRCFFFDENGEFITPAYVSALMAKYYLQKFPGSRVLHDTRVVRVIDHVVEENGGVSVANKAGYSFIKERMMKDDIVFGCETSGHYFFKDYGYHDNGLFPFLVILEILSLTDKTFSQVLAPLREKFYISEEINFTIQNQNILEEIKENYKDARIENIDGYDFNYPDWRFNLRKSNTENLLRLNVEADSQNLLERKIKEVTALVDRLK